VVKKLITIPEYLDSPRIPYAIVLKQLAVLGFLKQHLIETKGQIKESVQLYFMTKNNQHQYKYLVAGKVKTLFLAKSYMKLIPKCCSV
jgi:hypothetical protein